MIAFFAATSMLATSSPASWGEDALAMLRREYFIEASGLYAERPDRRSPAFNWGVGVMLSALNAAARHNPKHKAALRAYADASRVYWQQGGYDVLPTTQPLDRYYDDNAWMALALVETYEVLGDKKYLDWAQGALDFALAGASQEGGIFWRERDRASRNTCSTAPTAAACLAVSRHTRDPKLREPAQRLVDWTRRTLEDPADGLYWDHVDRDGKIEKTKWSYNSALMIAAMRGLGMPEARRTLTASKARWLKSGRLDDEGRFAHLLLETWVEAEGARPEFVEVLRGLQIAKSARGFVPPHWGKAKLPDNPEILDQAAFARACFVLAGAKAK
ncbi:MAG TPA: glycoside hydrolase family 76 protein [Fimbriimonadaceae bacterium]|nr:glycoside hydrolase family 76 protein [Fimbriimonadaceae bacterium]